MRQNDKYTHIYIFIINNYYKELYILYIRTLYTIYNHNIYTIYTQFTHQIYISYIHNVYTIYIQYIYKKYIQYIHNIYKKYKQYIHHAQTNTQWYTISKKITKYLQQKKILKISCPACFICILIYVNKNKR